PLGQWAAAGEPAAHEGPAGVLRPGLVDRAVMPRTEWARLSRVDRVAVDRDLQPPIAAGGARLATPRRFACRGHSIAKAAGAPPARQRPHIRAYAASRWRT